MEYNIKITDEEFNKCKEFAEVSARTQRPNRSGGVEKRNLPKIIVDTFRGKVGEVVIKRFLEQAPLNVLGIELDFKIYPRGVWDRCDITLNGIKLSVKSAKHFSHWLLLESKDVARGEVYDYYILVLIDEDYKGGRIKGFAFKNEIIIQNPNTLLLKQGDCIPGTQTELDADNHGRREQYLHNTEEDWVALANKLKP